MGEGQNQDQEGHGRQAWRLPQTLRGIKMAGQLAILLVSGSLIFPDTEEVTSSNLVPPTRFSPSFRRSAAYREPIGPLSGRLFDLVGHFVGHIGIGYCPALWHVDRGVRAQSPLSTARTLSAGTPGSTGHAPVAGAV